jgi:hypothetical protein
MSGFGNGGQALSLHYVFIPYILRKYGIINKLRHERRIMDLIGKYDSEE